MNWGVLQSLPLWEVFAAGGVLIGFIIGIITGIRIRKNKKMLIRDLEAALDSGVFPSDMYTSQFLLKRSNLIENFAKTKGPEILELTGLSRLWLEQYRKKPGRKVLESILSFIPEKGMFTAFLGVLKKPSLTETFFTRIGIEPGTLRKLPLSGSGEAFNSLEAKKFFSERLDEIREMAGDPEWPVRYFAVKILLTEDDDRSKRGVKEAFSDSHPLIRKTVIEEESFMERDELYPVLLDHMINDPSEEVRTAAYDRIMKDFSDDFTISYDGFDDVQILHALNFLRPEREHDVDTAFRFLKSDNLEIRFPAARFLQEHGFLHKILLDSDFKDSELLDRNIDLLVKASEVKVDGFLSEDISGSAPVFAAMSILAESGDRRYIGTLAERFFTSSEAEADRKVWEAIVNSISLRGDERAVSVLMNEFERRMHDEVRASFILEKIPSNMEHKVYAGLLKALTDPGFTAGDALVKALNKLPPEIVLPDLFKILSGGRMRYSHVIRITALKVLAGYKLSYCLQLLIEQLPTLPVENARDFSTLLASYSGNLFNSRILKILEQNDAKVRAAVIASLPDTGIKEFLKPVKEALSDADPDVRIASVWALAGYGEKKVLNQAIDMLRDPVERVRTAAAEAISTFASAENLEKYLNVAKDPHEVPEVKKAVIRGLSKSGHREAVDFLIQIMDEEEELSDAAMDALSKMTAKKSLKIIIENIKDAAPSLRQKIMQSLKKMGPAGEETIADLLEEDIASLKDQICRILEESGYVEHKVRLLSHRDPVVRKNTARFLSRLGTEAAFRGIVLAARDPEEDVRVEVTRALEKLNSDSGKEILEKLKNDPDKRVRKFTLWALERIHSQTIED